MPKKLINYDIFHKKTSKQTKLISKNNFTYKIILETIDTFLNPKTTKKILDIGCGAGTLCLYYAKQGYNVTGIDISNKAVVSAKQSAKHMRLKNITFSKMQFPEQIPSDKYDFIIFTEVIEHLKDDQLALKKIYTLLNKNGILLLSTPSSNAPLHRLGITRNFDKEVGHLRRYSLTDLEKKAQNAGFTVLGTRKTEGILRNFLFINPVAGKFVRFVRYFIVDIVMLADRVTLHLFGESNLFIILQKK